MEEDDKILDKAAFRAWMEGSRPYSIDVMYERKSGYRAFLYDEDKKALWRSAVKRTAPKAKAYAEGFSSLYRGLGQRKMAGMADPAAQIAYGIGERQPRKATHG